MKIKKEIKSEYELYNGKLKKELSSYSFLFLIENKPTNLKKIYNAFVFLF